VDRLEGVGNTVGALIDRLPVPDKPNTAKSVRSLDKIIRAKLGTAQCSEVTVAMCAELVDGIAAAGKARSAESVRSRLIALFRKGQALGWMDFDPASITERPRVKVQRGRLTLESFKAVYAQAAVAAEWLPAAMMLALVTGADRSTIAGLQRSDVADGYLTITRIKTGARVAIPLALRMDAVGVTLADLVSKRTGVVSRYLVHHVSVWGNAPAGSKVHPDRLSHAFTEARRAAGIPDEGAPTFHEIRSLAKRLYEQQGGVDTKALLGHATERMSALYADPRGVEPIRVRVG
jgi:integrase